MTAVLLRHVLQLPQKSDMSNLIKICYHETGSSLLVKNININNALFLPEATS